MIHSRNGRHLSRRSLLGSLGPSTLLLGGCLSYTNENDGPASSSVSIANSSGRERDVQLLVRDEDAGVRLLDEIVSVPTTGWEQFDFEAKNEEAMIHLRAETDTDSESLRHSIRAGGTTSFFIEIRRDETISISVGMQ